MERKKIPIRVLVAKPGLDGHDKGAKVVVRALRDAGMEAIYTGLRQTVDQIVRAAIQEDVDVIGLSILSGAHLGLTAKLMKRMQEEKMEDKMVILGGIIPREDILRLKEMGVAEVFPVGTNFAEIIHFLQEKVEKEG
ncbi:MAG: cobalamin B12-binding domain-containing protein [Thermodesulfobacteriota bacterium]|nr:cobalamin B12-binding domain-containing protein [Thermodesulfobacteriota bacterium]